MRLSRRQMMLLLSTVGRGASGNVWTCPMDPDVQTAGPGRCPRCRMSLVPRLPELREYPVTVDVRPRAPRPGAPVTLTFRVRNPQGGAPVRQFDEVHERLFHLFLVSEDLRHFAHEHPELQKDGSFVWQGVLPRSGMYRLLCDFLPSGATPQLIPKTVIVPGRPSPAPPLQPDMMEKQGENLRVALRSGPETPLAGKPWRLRFDLTPSDKLEPYLGAAGHLLVASADLIDTIHAHPFTEEPSPTLEFRLLPPRAGLHRVWLQVQRAGVVNTVAFNVPVAEL